MIHIACFANNFFRNLIDDWMEHYRIAVGLSSPALQAVSERPQYSIETRQAKSAKQSEHSLMIRKAVLGIDDDVENLKKARVPSAPLGKYCDPSLTQLFFFIEGNT